MTSLLLIFFSFSSGGWSAALFQVFDLYVLRIDVKKVSIKALGVFLILFGLLITFFSVLMARDILAPLKEKLIR